jgi:biotin carboxyl carrier protein
VKYVVEVAGETLEVVVEGTRVLVNGKPTNVSLTELPGTPVVLLTIDGVTHHLTIGRTRERGRVQILTPTSRLEATAVDERTRMLRQLAESRTSKAQHTSLTAPMPGLVLRVEVQPGQLVEAGQGLIVMEAMKMENELRAVSRGTVKSVRVEPGSTVEKGALLVEFEPPVSVD